MDCPILPVGESVTQVLPVPSELARALNQALASRGYLSGSLEGYDRVSAVALGNFQRDNPVQTGADAALATITGISHLRFASCATYAALGIPCDRVSWSVGIWAPIIGREAAIAAGGAIALASDQGLLSLRCPVTAPPPLPGGGAGGTAEGIPSWVWVAGLGALLLARRRRV